ncbi:hypothetical protein Fot_06097 [Forsythia ovata]|uniref:Uncharacterized protein n=1 Tax=Forsythia ovata TaxID=205694 RepID=A0ABD1WS19_9LAMI
MAAGSMMLIQETEMEVFDMELTKQSSETALQNKEVRTLLEDNERLKADLASFEITTKVLAEANTQRDGLVDKIAHLDETAESLRVECSDLKGENLKLNSETEEAVKAGVENFRNQFEFTTNYENLQAFFVNFGAQQVLSELKEQHPNLDLSTIEIDYTTPDEAEEAVDQPPADGN